MADLSNQLNGLLANAIIFYHKLHNYHWAVEGRDFFDLHAKFEEYYDQWAEILDDVAERILQIGGRPLPTLAEALKLATIKEDPSKPDAREMVQIVLDDMLTQHKQMRDCIVAAEEAADRSTANLLDGPADAIEKQAWMLKAWLA